MSLLICPGGKLVEWSVQESPFFPAEQHDGRGDLEEQEPARQRAASRNTGVVRF